MVDSSSIMLRVNFNRGISTLQLSDPELAEINQFVTNWVLKYKFLKQVEEIRTFTYTDHILDPETLEIVKTYHGKCVSHTLKCLNESKISTKFLIMLGSKYSFKRPLLLYFSDTYKKYVNPPVPNVFGD